MTFMGLNMEYVIKQLRLGVGGSNRFTRKVQGVVKVLRLLNINFNLLFAHTKYFAMSML